MPVGDVAVPEGPAGEVPVPLFGSTPGEGWLTQYTRALPTVAG